MKKLQSLVVGLFTVFSMASCGDNEDKAKIDISFDDRRIIAKIDESENGKDEIKIFKYTDDLTDSDVDYFLGGREISFEDAVEIISKYRKHGWLQEEDLKENSVTYFHEPNEPEF
jgi:uncharacterized lipoprotein YehR (DUF1307 family)